MNKKKLTEAQIQELLLRMKKNYTYDAKSGRLISSRLGRAVRGKKLGKKGYLCVLCCLGKRQVYVRLHHAVWAVCKGRWPEQQVLLLLTVYMDLQECNQLTERRLSLVYAQCATFVFNYLYRAGQLKTNQVGFDPEIRKHINDVFITIAKENDEH